MSGMAGKTVVITGASSGIGLETARALAGMGARIVAVVRNRAKAEAALPGTELVIADLYSLADVRRAAAEIRATCDRLDVLVNNAGLIHDRRELTVDGFERTFALNHLAVFLLTYELRELLAASGPARIVTVASMGHRFARLAWDDLARRERWPGPTAVYGASKLCNIWFARESARRMASHHVTSNSLHPGAVASSFGASGSPMYLLGVRLARPFLKSAAEGARTSVFLASAPGIEGASGLYFADSRATKPSSRARHDASALRLWELSERLCGVTWS
jgi:retinol dehydrogenase 12